MSPNWKYTKKAHKQLCEGCGKKLRKDEILFCRECWSQHDYSPYKRWNK